MRADTAQTAGRKQQFRAEVDGWMQRCFFAAVLASSSLQLIPLHIITYSTAHSTPHHHLQHSSFHSTSSPTAQLIPLHIITYSTAHSTPYHHLQHSSFHSTSSPTAQLIPQPVLITYHSISKKSIEKMSFRAVIYFTPRCHGNRRRGGLSYSSTPNPAFETRNALGNHKPHNKNVNSEQGKYERMSGIRRAPPHTGPQAAANTAQKTAVFTGARWVVQGVMVVVQGVMVVVQGVMVVVQGFIVAVHGVIVAVHGVIVAVYGVIVAVYGVIVAVHGVIVAVHGVIVAVQRVIVKMSKFTPNIGQIWRDLRSSVLPATVPSQIPSTFRTSVVTYRLLEQTGMHRY
ncbi:hypothetical protein FHG87_019634 [Trinorchestia longiramus]|nr:hypothetical protein FHG87_019634 [Trinorchestia longiramus]